MAIQGHVDHMEGAYVTGWAIAVPDSGNCVIAVTDSSGQELARGRASRHREDLVLLGAGRSTLGFRIPVPLEGGPRSLRILANGEEVPGSPVMTGPGLYDGDGELEQDSIIGWVTERTPGFAAPCITITNQWGEEVGRGQSGFSAQDADPHFRPARFAITLDDQCFGAGEMVLTLRANGVAFASASCELGLIGNIEIFSPTRCLGWLLSPNVPARVYPLEVYRDGRLAAEACNDVAREDVSTHHAAAVTPGFDITLEPEETAITAPVALSLRVAGSTRDLFEGPYLFASRAAAVSAAHRVARLANLSLPGIGPGERAVLTQAIADYLARTRAEDGAVFTHQAVPASDRKLAIIIPIYRGLEETHACIASVLAHRNAESDLLILINDCSPEPMMAVMLAACAQLPNVVVLTNSENLGFVRTVNRGLGAVAGADVLLLNADTVLHAGGLEELKRIAVAHPDIGTITAMSSNATIFSYPHPELRREALEDVSWTELAALALKANAGRVEDVPTGHGFCMFIKDEVLRRVGRFDEAFGRGYGEENDFCARATALGYRNVAAGGVLVEHKESVSFSTERASLLARNMPRLNTLYPEYTPVIMQFEREDGLRRLRWGLDAARLARARAAGTDFVLVVTHELEGGTARAVRDIEGHTLYGGAKLLTLSVGEGGLLMLSAEAPLLRAGFAPEEVAELFALLDAAVPGRVMVHQLLGFPAGFLAALGPWLTGRESLFWAHDFYAFCPRVTMIDAIGRFCGGADADTCARCVEMEGAHEASRLTDLTPAGHRALFAGLLASFTHRLVPSANAAAYLSRLFPRLTWEVLPHPEPEEGVAAKARAGSDDEIVLLGAIGPHKGSQLLLDIARRARLTHPHLHFRVIGYTNLDKALKAIGNVTITGVYAPEDLPALLAEAKGRLGLFLPGWPETYSYTLSELVRHGFIPLVPDIGAPADRVRAAKFGVVFPFPASPEAVLQIIDDIASGKLKPVAKGASPLRFFSSLAALARLRQLAGHAPALEVADP
ncbi:MAG TPA: glycosyltransferase [Acidocella sp.]|jgi:GT2 family glycosyltransferase/glycosyltransferase involved in cell wall biosynthesis|nr:glycosyltransferase [Acidocella sp.]